MNSSQLADKLAKLVVATAMAVSAPTIMAQTAKPVAPASTSPASLSVKASASAVVSVVKPEVKKDNAESPCAPGNPCTPGKKKKKKSSDNPCAPASPCAPKK